VNTEGEVVELTTALVMPGPAVRAERIDFDHVTRLRLAIDDLPPIVVREGRVGWSLVDGQHRLSAHKFEGRETIRAVVVELSDAEALEAAVAANVEHGLVLTIPERKAVARRLVADTDWSDRRIAASCGLDGKTVVIIRPARSTAEIPQLNAPAKTEGVDGKARPATAADAAAGRRRAAEHIEANPKASLREVAEVAGVAVATALSVRNERNENPAGQAPKLAAAPEVEQGAPSVGESVTLAPVAGQWVKATGFDTSNDAYALARLLDRRLPRPEDRAEVIAACPAAQREAVIASARAAALWWSSLADLASTPKRMEIVR
jgi:ParB-like chromosome segregation protein Spo0J